MDLQEKYFLVAAQEKSITAAARKLFISQQCLSKHIQQLEARYQVPLFIRKPVFSLTPAGECIAHNLSKIATLETNMQLEVNEYSENNHSTIRFGISQMYYTTICSDVIPAYHNMFPNVFVDVVHSNSSAFEQHCQEGRIDLFFDDIPGTPPLLNVKPVIVPALFLGISDRLLRQTFGSSTNSIIHEMQATGCDIRLFKKTPFIMQSKNQGSGLSRIQKYCIQKGFTPLTKISCEGLVAKAALAMEDYVAFFTTGLGVLFLNKLYSSLDSSQKLHFFLLPDYVLHPLSICWHKERFLSTPEKALVSLISDVCEEKTRILINEYPALKNPLKTAIL